MSYTPGPLPDDVSRLDEAYPGMALADQILAYAAAEVARAVAAEREQLAEVVRDMYREAKAELQDKHQNTWYDGYCDGLEAASNRLRADTQRLQGKGECR